jgi:hypothetical protein
MWQLAVCWTGTKILEGILVSTFFFWPDSPPRVRTASFVRFIDHTQRHTTIARIPLDGDRPVQRPLPYNTQKRQISITYLWQSYTLAINPSVIGTDAFHISTSVCNYLKLIENDSGDSETCRT